MSESSEECSVDVTSRSNQAESEYLSASCATDCSASQEPLPKM
jgi:hypothetical protein